MFLYEKYYYGDEMDIEDDNALEEEEKMKNCLEIDREPRTDKTYPLNLIVYGAPGTGKTYGTAEYALKIIGAPLPDNRKDVMKTYNDLVRKGQIVFTTFHQSYGYEEFIQGLRPDTKSDKMSFKTVDGVFKRIADRALNDLENNYVIIIDEINRANISKVFGELITLIEDDKRWGEINETYGNVILVREADGNLSEDQYTKFLKSDVPPQKLSIDIKENADHIKALVRDLADGDIEMSNCHEQATETDFEALRKFGLIYARDLATGDVTPISQTFDKYVDEKQRQRIIENFPIERTSEDITLSYDQAENLHDAIVKGMAYPELTGENDEIDFEKLVDFMWELRRLFKWDIYEKKTIGKRGNGDEKSVIRWYCTILLRWIRGNGLNTIVRSAVRYKENNPWTGVWSGDYMVEETYNPNSKYHKNLVIAESLSVIENVLLFSISNYFRKFSMEYKAVHQVENFDNDWYEYVEYGTTNPITIFLQQNGFSREASIYIQTPSNYSKYVTDVDGEKKIKRSILECGNIGVETEAQDIQFNIPELFVE